MTPLGDGSSSGWRTALTVAQRQRSTNHRVVPHCIQCTARAVSANDNDHRSE
eukprot:m.334675 g.334675  ORF g.334675 m.334675 type:complete len:52 (-) comp16529_c0_seq16:125-280(-)